VSRRPTSDEQGGATVEAVSAAGPATDPSVATAVLAAVGAARGVRVSLAVLALVSGAAALWMGQSLFLPIVIAVLLTLLLTPAVDFTDRIGVPRWLGAALVVVGLFAGLAGAATQLTGPAERWLNPRSPEWRKLEDRVRALKRPLEQLQEAQGRVAGIAETPGQPKVREVLVERRDMMATLGGAKPIVVGSVSTIVLLYFLLVSGDMFLRKLIRVLPRMTDKKTAVGIARTIQTEIGRYFFTIAMINLGLGLATTVLMLLLGMPSAIFWGALVAVLNFIPYAGPAVSLTLLTAGAFVSLDTWAHIMMVPLCFFVLVLIEGQLVQPVLVGRRLRLNVVVTFLAVLFWGWLWGLGGVAVAVPLLVVLKICADHIEAMSTIGEFVSRDEPARLLVREAATASPARPGGNLEHK
jgi:predicted PurR-regulated permease PerM